MMIVSTFNAQPEPAPHLARPEARAALAQPSPPTPKPSAVNPHHSTLTIQPSTFSLLLSSLKLSDTQVYEP